jgi:hypothetical protein
LALGSSLAEFVQAEFVQAEKESAAASERERHVIVFIVGSF